MITDDDFSGRPTFADHLTDLYGSDLAEQVIADLTLEIDHLRQRSVGIEFDGVWEEGYSDALHDVMRRINTPTEPDDGGGSLSRLVGAVETAGLR